MNRKHAVSISLAVGLAALAGTVAATKTVRLGHPAGSRAPATSAVIASRTRALDRTEIALRKALTQRPPKLPPLPANAPAATTQATSPVAATAPSTQPQRVVYVRPAPRIVTIHRAGGEQEAEGGSHEDRGGEGGFDD